MANYQSSHTGATIDDAVGKVANSGVTQADLTKLSDVTATAAQLDETKTLSSTYHPLGGSSTQDFIAQNLTVHNTFLTKDSQNVQLGDAIITLNAEEAGTPTENAGIEVERGTSTNVILRWNETADRWEFTNDGTTYYNIPISTEYATYVSSDFTHDDLTGFEPNEHIDHSTISITAGSGLTGGGTIDANSTLNVGEGTGITVNADDIEVNASQTQITAIGTITTGTWNATKIASAYLDDDTAHLSGTQTFTGTKTFKATTGNANLYLESVTDNAWVIIDSNTDNLGTEQSGIVFRDNGINKWQISKNTGNDFRIYDYTRVATVFEILDNGDATFSVNLNADAGLTVTGNISVTGTVDGRDIATDGTTLDGIYTSITGDIAITSGGVATIQANSVALGTDTTGNYVASIIGGEGITSSGAATGEGINHSLSVNLDDFVAKTSIVDADLIAIVDSADSDNNKKITFSNFKSSLNLYTDWNLYVGGVAKDDVTSGVNVNFALPSSVPNPSDANGTGLTITHSSGGTPTLETITFTDRNVFNGLSAPTLDKIPYYNYIDGSTDTVGWVTLGTGLSFSGGTLDTAAVTVDRFTKIITDESRPNNPLTAQGASDTLDFLGGSNISTSSSQTGSVVTITINVDDASLNADTVDSLHASSFVRSDASDSMSGALSISQATAATATLSVTNSGGYTNDAIIARFIGDSDALDIRNDSAGDYKIINSQQGNGISIYDGTGGVSLRYNGTDVAGCDSSGGFEVKSGNLTAGGFTWNGSVLTAESSSDAPITTKSTDGTTGIQFKDSNSGAGRIYYVGNSNYFYMNNSAKLYLRDSGSANDITLDPEGKSIFVNELQTSDKFTCDTITGLATNFDISQSTTTGVDAGRTRVNGGGAAGDTRGGYIELHGNEHSNTGQIRLLAGNVTGGEIRLYTSGVERFTVEKNGTTVINASLVNKVTGDTDVGLRIQRASASGRAQYTLENESGTQLWRCGLTGAAGTTYAFWNTSVNVLQLSYSDNSATFAGSLKLNDANTQLSEGSSNSLRVTTDSGYVDIGPQNTSWCHIQTNRGKFYFNKEIRVDTGCIGSYNENLQLRTSGTTRLTLDNSTGNATFAALTQVNRATSGNNGSGGTNDYTIYASAGGQCTIGAFNTATSGYSNLNLGDGTGFWHISKRLSTNSDISGSHGITFYTYDYNGTSFTARFGFTTGGEFRAVNDITAYYSDARLKDFHGVIENPLDKVMKLNGYYFTENAKAKELGYTNDRMQVGVSAQEIEQVLPELIKDAPIGHGYKTIDYGKITPLLIEAIKEQQQQINELKRQIGEA